MGLARVPRSRCARWATGWLAAGLGRLSGVKAISRSDGGVGVLRSSGCRDGFRPPLFQRNLIRLGPLDSGHAERVPIPVPLPPPTLSVLRFLHGRDGRKSLNKVGRLSKNQTVLESAELGDLSPGDGIFLQSLVLRRFSIV